MKMVSTIISVLVIVICFLFMANTSITLSPFKIQFEALSRAIGFFMVLIGVGLIAEYYHRAGKEEAHKEIIDYLNSDKAKADWQELKDKKSTDSTITHEAD